MNSNKTTNKSDLALATKVRRAAERISKPGAWCQGEWARDRDGMPTDLHEPEAASWCLVGALSREDADDDAVYRALGVFAVNGPDMAEWNDTDVRTQSEVVTALCFAASIIEAGDAE